MISFNCSIEPSAGDKTVSPLAIPPTTSVGGTVAASMQCRQKVPHLSVEHCVLEITEQACSVPDLSGPLPGLEGSTKVIVESLVWCFVARRSFRSELFSRKEYGRFVVSMRETARRIAVHQSSDCREQSFVKYWTDSYMAMGFLDRNRPERPAWLLSNLFVGWCKRFVARSIARRDLSFLYSLQKGSKQMWPPLKDENVRRAIQKSKDRLCAPRGHIPEYSNARQTVSDVIRNMSDKIFKHDPSDSLFGFRFMPSGSAVLQASQSNGGALSLFKPIRDQQSAGDSSSFSYLPGALPNLVRSIDNWRSQTFDTAVKRAYEAVSVTDSDGMLPCFDVRFVPIFEPGKIRNISVSDGYLATALQPLQGFMLQSWKRTKWSTMLEGDLTERVRLMDRENPNEPLWCSGDYEAATDLLFKEATVACLNSLSWHPLFGLAYLSIIMGRMIYPDLSSLKYYDKSGAFIGEKLDMYEGQLMGHTLSFPMLCIINLSVLRHALDLWVNESKTQELEVERAARAERIFSTSLVNGDDILFKGEQRLFDIFRGVSESVGFKISQGKNYFSPDSCMINSQMFRRVSGRMERYGYLNLRLVKGNNIKARIAGGESPCTPEMIGKDLGLMVRFCPWSSSALPACFNRWSKDWKGSWFQPNWYLPVHLGGYGVPLELAPSDFRITRAQRLIAAKFVHDPTLSLYRRSGASSAVLGKFRLLTKSVLIPGDYVPREEELVDDWMGRLSYYARAELGEQRSRQDVKVILRRQKRDFRLHPMSSEGLLRYWYAQAFMVGTPVCPPIGAVRYDWIRSQPVLA